MIPLSVRPVAYQLTSQITVTFHGYHIIHGPAATHADNKARDETVQNTEPISSTR
jgi:hypothetical protein